MSPLKSSRTLVLVTLLLVVASAVPASAQPTPRTGPRTVTVDLAATTQGPFWPPSEVGNEDGDFVVVGGLLSQIAPGVFVPIPGAALVSKDTVPPLDDSGVATPFNWFSTTYDVIRPLDLRPGSPDMEMVLYSHSWGPAAGDHGPVPRIPAEGDSLHNLNGLVNVCPELFPTGAQLTDYRRPAYPLHEVPIWGFQGDQVAYDPVTGEEFDPATATGAGCPFEGCSGEDVHNQRRTDPITLGEWLQARGRVRITLEDFDRQAGGFTAARFSFQFRRLIPNAVYTVWAVRNQAAPIPGIQRQRRVTPIAIPNVFITDSRGNAAPSFKVVNPFPDPATDFPQSRRLALFNIVFHPDYQNWGACFGRFGAGVDVSAHLSSFATTGIDVAPSFVTVPPSNSN